MISQGANVATAFKLTGLFSGFTNSQISAGEASGQLDKSFRAAANDYEAQFMRQIDVVIKLIEPALLLVTGVALAILAFKFFATYYGSLSKI